MRTEALAPMRLAPARSMVEASARERMPPDAFTPQRSPAMERIRVMSATVAPPVEKPVLVLMKSAPASTARCDARCFLVCREQGCFKNHLEDAVAAMRQKCQLPDFARDLLVHARFQKANVQNHVNVVRPRGNDRLHLVQLVAGAGSTQRKADDDANGNTGPTRSASTASGTQQGLIMAQAKRYSAASAHSSRTCCCMASGLSSVWSSTDASADVLLRARFAKVSAGAVERISIGGPSRAGVAGCTILRLRSLVRAARNCAEARSDRVILGPCPSIPSS